MAKDVDLYIKLNSTLEELKVGTKWELISNKPTTYTPISHSHGNLNNDGSITTYKAISFNDRLVIASGNDNKITKSNIPFQENSSYQYFILNQMGQFLDLKSNMKTINNQSLFGTGNITISGGSGGGGDVYLANSQEFTGVNTFSNNVFLNHMASGKKVQIDIGQQGAAKIVVNPEGNPEQTTTTFSLYPTWNGGSFTLLHSGNIKTINNQSILGSGNISISGGGSTSGNWELLRARAASTSLTSVNSGTTAGSVSLTKSISQGDVLAIELNSTSSATYNPIVLTITVQRISTNPNSYNSDYNLESFTSWTGTELRVNNFSISASGTNLYFGNKKYIRGYFSGSTSTIEWTTNQSYTLYVGRVWRLVQ